MSISLDEKMRYLREIENIHRLSKKVLPPQGTTWAQIADKHLQKALGLPVKEQGQALDVRPDGYMHEHSPRTARLVERTLRSGMIHPNVLHSYRNDFSYEEGYSVPRFKAEPVLAHDDPPVIMHVQHGGSDLIYPHGHLQGYGFVPSTHEAARHIQLEDSVRPVSDAVPTGPVASGATYQ